MSGDEEHTLPAGGRRRPAPGEGKHRFGAGDVLAGRFEIVSFLSQGGMGEVYEAQDRLLKGSRVALKTILSSEAAGSDARNRLEREVMLARQVIHPNVCPTYDLFQTPETEGGVYFLTMKLLPGESLAQRLAQVERVPLAEALSISRQVAGALRAAHQSGVIHRDLKPGNIMLDGSGSQVTAIVTDFGLARTYASDSPATGTGLLMGTPGYVAPEILNGYPATPASDIYAFGVVLHQMVTGRIPLTGTVERQLAGERSGEKRILRSYFQLIQGCVQPDPDLRLRAFEQAARGWEPGAAGLAYRRPAGTRRQWMTAMIAAGAAVAAGVTIARENWWEDVLHPLPRKRFVAVFAFPPVPTPLQPLVSGAIEAIEAALSRAEAEDRNLLVIAASSTATSQAAELAVARDSLGANMALAVYAAAEGTGLRLLLKIMDATSGAVLRLRQVVSPSLDPTSIPRSAVAAAADLLDVRLHADALAPLAGSTESVDAYAAFQTAETLMKQHNDAGLDKAIESYKTALESDPGYALAYGGLALAYCRLFSLHGDPAALDMARGNAETGLRLNRQLVGAHLALSSVASSKGQKQQALAEIRAALAIAPKEPKVLFFQAQYYRLQSQWAEAERIYHRMLEERPNYWLAYNDLGYVLNAQGKYREALQAFRSAALAAPGAGLAYNNVGEMLFKLGDFEGARQNFQRSLEIKPSDLVYSSMATALRAQGKASDALPFCLKATAANPADDQNWLELGDCYEAIAGHAAEARAAYLRAAQEVESLLSLNPGDANGLIRLALYRLKLGRGKAVSGEVAGLLDKAGDVGSLDLDTRVAAARVYELQGNRKQAVMILSECMAQGLTAFEISFIPDLQALRRDPAFKAAAVASSKTPAH